MVYKERSPVLSRFLLFRKNCRLKFNIRKHYLVEKHCKWLHFMLYKKWKKKQFHHLRILERKNLNLVQVLQKIFTRTINGAIKQISMSFIQWGPAAFLHQSEMLHYGLFRSKNGELDFLFLVITFKFHSWKETTKKVQALTVCSRKHSCILFWTFKIITFIYMFENKKKSLNCRMEISNQLPCFAKYISNLKYKLPYFFPSSLTRHCSCCYSKNNFHSFH